MDQTYSIRHLQNFDNYSPSESCSLDGRYFSIVLRDYPGLVCKAIEIEIGSDESIARETKIDLCDSHVTIVRLVIHTPLMKHCLVLFVDKKHKKAELWDPKEYSQAGQTIDDASDYMLKFVNRLIPLDYEFRYTSVYFDTDFPSQCSEDSRGYCNAYVLKETLDRLTGQKHNPNYDIRDVDVKKFIAAVEDRYSNQLVGKPDIEYGPRGGGYRGGYYGGHHGGYHGGYGFGGYGTGLLTGTLLGAAIAGSADNDVQYVYPYPYYGPYLY